VEIRGGGDVGVEKSRMEGMEWRAREGGMQKEEGVLTSGGLQLVQKRCDDPEQEKKLRHGSHPGRTFRKNW
jgi:hypothetical protein